ncbi:metalloregulator ArsR/SmtB family transcription factor [Hymenobacter sp. BT730]|uniref:ArsR/SmtB family transcription factor n=1 Tax=Hymenobacter sp. BT730 TaxID=3063332 RepID=UPI0026E0615E|nr:metalloregulator ArsR/SmtB family transcription factor [Hymenobacter sp. BT730]
MTTSACSRVFADPTHLAQCLQQPLCVCDLADVLQRSGSAISQHLRKRKDGGVIQDRQVGQTVFYSLPPAPLPLMQPLLAAATAAQIPSLR